MVRVRLPSYEALELLSTRETGVALKMLHNGPVGGDLATWIIGSPTFTFVMRAMWVLVLHSYTSRQPAIVYDISYKSSSCSG